MQPPDYPKTPEQRIAIAAGVARALGVACLVLSTLLCLIYAALGMGLDLVRFSIAYIVGIGPTLIVPGVLYLVFASKVDGRRRWAAITNMVLSILQGLMFGLPLVLGLVLANGQHGVLDGQACLVLLVFAVMFVLCLATAIQSGRALGAMARLAGPGHGAPYGFEPVMPVMVRPVEEETGKPMEDGGGREKEGPKAP